MVAQRKIKSNLDKIKALINMEFPYKLRDIQRLIGRLAILNRFLSRAIKKYLPFFKVTKQRTGDLLTEEYEASFQRLKVYLSIPPL